MKDIIKETMQEYINEGLEIDLFLFTEEFYKSEWNYNNADKTSGQRVYTESELFDLVKQIKEEVIQ